MPTTSAPRLRGGTALAHDLVILLNVLRSVILVASLVGVLIHKRVDRRLTLVVASLLLLMNLCGLAIATFLVNHGT